MKTPWLSRDARLGIGLVVLLVLITALAATQKETRKEYPVLSTLSSAPNGARALKLWVQELNYDVDERALAEFDPPENASILFMLEPLFPTEGEMDLVDTWVEEGGTLIAIGEAYGMFSLIDHYEFFFDFLPANPEPPAIDAPLLLSPSAFGLTNAPVRVALDSQRDDYVTLVTYAGNPVLVSFEQGKGRVILGTLSQSLTNAGLKQGGNPELVLNILALAKAKGPVWFDEWHHGEQGGEQLLGPGEFLRSTPVGRSLLFIVFAVFIAFFLQGRGFGRPIPLPQEIRRRGALEHVTGIANLSRRAAHRSAVMMHYHDQIKRKLGQRYRLDPGMDDEQYTDKLSDYNASIDRNELLNLLKRLQRKDVGETEMVQLAVEASKWIDT